MKFFNWIQLLIAEDPCDETTLAVWKGAYRLVLRELDSSNKEVRELSMKIFSLIPTLVANFKETNLKIIIAEDSSIDAKMAFLRHQPVNLRMVDFKVLADALLKTPDQSYAALMAVFDSYVSDPSFSRFDSNYIFLFSSNYFNEAWKFAQNVMCLKKPQALKCISFLVWHTLTTARWTCGKIFNLLNHVFTTNWRLPWENHRLAFQLRFLTTCI